MRLLSIAICVLVASAAARAAEPVTVSAAVSLKEALSATAATCHKDANVSPQFNFGATGHLLAQIRDGAPVDVFISASREQMDQAQSQGLVDPETRAVIAGNELVLIAPKRSQSNLRSFADLADPSLKRLAIGQPKTVPAGQYAAQVLKHLHLETAVAQRIVYGESVRQVLDYVVRGEVDAAIVYATDARQAGEDVQVITAAEPAWHEPIQYVAAIVNKSEHAEAAKRFVAFLRGESAQRRLHDFGFAPPTTHPATR